MPRWLRLPLVALCAPAVALFALAPKAATTAGSSARVGKRLRKSPALSTGLCVWSRMVERAVSRAESCVCRSDA